jgi:hypothetical protein
MPKAKILDAVRKALKSNPGAEGYVTVGKVQYQYAISGYQTMGARGGRVKVSVWGFGRYIGRVWV